MRYAGTRALHADHNPLRSIPLFRPASAVFGYTDEQCAEFNRARDLGNARPALDSANNAVACARRAYVEARREIGEANRGISRGIQVRDRRQAKSIAFRMFNIRLRELRAAEKRREAAEAAYLALVEA